MISLPFTKMSGAGNDFVVAESRVLPRPAARARRLCDRRRGIGADGLLALSRSKGGARVLYFNANGSRAFCGNGVRCAAQWAFLRGWTRGRKEFPLETDRGAIKARITGRERASIRMPDPRRLRMDLSLHVLGRRRPVHSIDTGVPHAVVIVDDLDDHPVLAAGRALRRHPVFGPRGTNADFASFRRGRAFLRTYERGVEDETLACGTGAVAAALVGARLGLCRSPVSVRVKSGEDLRVAFKRDGDSFADVWLEGPAKIIFEGTYKSK